MGDNSWTIPSVDMDVDTGSSASMDVDTGSRADSERGGFHHRLCCHADRASSKTWGWEAITLTTRFLDMEPY